jgi:hypothetical protein
MKRETFKEPEYFAKRIEFSEGMIPKYQAVIDNPATEERHRTRLLYSILTRSALGSRLFAVIA